jgi:hypothetical protein
MPRCRRERRAAARGQPGSSERASLCGDVCCPHAPPPFSFLFPMFGTADAARSSAIGGQCHTPHAAPRHRRRRRGACFKTEQQRTAATRRGKGEGEGDDGCTSSVRSKERDPCRLLSGVHAKAHMSAPPVAGGGPVAPPSAAAAGEGSPATATEPPRPPLPLLTAMRPHCTAPSLPLPLRPLARPAHPNRRLACPARLAQQPTERGDPQAGPKIKRFGPFGARQRNRPQSETRMRTALNKQE